MVFILIITVDIGSDIQLHFAIQFLHAVCRSVRESSGKVLLVIRMDFRV